DLEMRKASVLCAIGCNEETVESTGFAHAGQEDEAMDDLVAEVPQGDALILVGFQIVQLIELVPIHNINSATERVVFEGRKRLRFDFVGYFAGFDKLADGIGQREDILLHRRERCLQPTTLSLTSLQPGDTPSDITFPRPRLPDHCVVSP